MKLFASILMVLAVCGLFALLLLAAVIISAAAEIQFRKEQEEA